MRNWKLLRLFAVVAALGLVAAACSDDDSDSDSSSDTTEAVEEEPAEEETSEQTIVDIAAGDEQFSTLVDAVTQAGLVETLSGEGPFTVFAPTNDAFAKIPAADLQAILADQEQLTAILTYHVLPQQVLSSDLQPSQSVPTVQGANVDIQVSDAGATINGCNITATDIQASNGVIHVIDCVLTPPAS